MGLLRMASQLHRGIWRVLSSTSSNQAPRFLGRARSCRVEQLESKCLLAASPIQVGSVYYEDAGGYDDVGDLIEITFEGGAPGTQLTELTIETDKLGDGLTIGDAFFDTEPTGLGAYGAVGLLIVDQTGIDSANISVADGGTTLLITFIGFDPGEKLAFTLDVDEQGFLDPNAVAEGNEFQGSVLAATFQADYYSDVSGSDIFLDYYDSELSSSGLNLPPDSYIPPGTSAEPVRTAGAIFELQQISLPSSLAGTVFVDADRDNLQDPGEPGIENVEVTLLREEGSGYVLTGQTATTDGSGNYRFDNVDPGTYRVAETQPSGFFSVGARAGTVGGQTRGTVTGVDEISQIQLNGGEQSVGNDFGEVRPGSLSGNVYFDADNDGVFDPEETGIDHVLVRVFPVAPDGSSGAPIEVFTGADGAWSVGNLSPGEYRVEEVQPAAYLDGLDAAGTVGGVAHNPGDLIDGIQLPGNTDGLRYDFGELIPASVAGRVIVDTNGDCAFDLGDYVLSGVTLELLDQQGTVVATTQTDRNGEYVFSGLAPGAYTVRETQPKDYFDGGDHVGSEGGVLGPPDSISAILLAPGAVGVGYDFCELESASLSGFVYVDQNDNGQRDPGEAPIAGVQLELLNASGTPTGRTTTTDSSGFYRFGDLQPDATYGVAEVQPDGYFDGQDSVGNTGGVANNPGDSITGAVVPAGVNAENYNFGEFEAGSLSGFVYVDQNGSGHRDPQETPIAGVELELLDSNGVGTGRTTTTDPSGFYRFDGLRPNTVYGVRESQPKGYYDGLDSPGTAEGEAHNPGDSITDVTILPGMHAQEYNFGELAVVSLSGYVYVDQNNNGLRDPGEAPIAGVEVELLNAKGEPMGRTTTTSSSGLYRFEKLYPNRIYGARETQPEGFYDGKDAAGNFGGEVENPGDLITQVLIPFGAKALQYNFGELRPASIGGRVHGELNGNCTPEPGEPRLADVTIYLLDRSGTRITSTTTDENGEYRFENLEPGTYGVEEIQPADYFDGPDHPGSAGGVRDGNDRIMGAKLISALDAVDYNFCEVVPGSISGHVFQDGPAIRVRPFTEPPPASEVRDGQFTHDDTPIEGVSLWLGDDQGNPIFDANDEPRTAVTDENGYYEFTHLAPGTYTVFEMHPAGYTDSIDRAGSRGGLAINPDAGIDPTATGALSTDPRNDAILSIQLGPGDQAKWYNFSEVLYVESPYIPPPAPLPRPASPLPPFPAPRDVPGGPPGARYIPQPGIQLGPMYGVGLGKQGPASFTWHLSVVNAGQPRHESGGVNAVASGFGTHFNPVVWAGHTLSQGEWRVAGANGNLARQFYFGMKGGIPLAGDFDGDGTTEVAVFLDGIWFIDLNGNGLWDNGDLWAQLGTEGDLPIVGDWDGDGKTDIGIFGPAWNGDARAIPRDPGLPDSQNVSDGRFKNPPPDPTEATVGWRTMKRTAEGKLRADVIDHVFLYGQEGDVPVSGDWNGDGVSNIGLFREGIWYLDLNGNGVWDTSDGRYRRMGSPGDLPVVGDFDGDGVDDLGVFQDGVWRLDADGDHTLTAHDRVFELGSAGDQPVVGDFNGDGIDEIGVYRDGVAKPDEQALRPGDNQPQR